jgi:hypothetical protein
MPKDFEIAYTRAVKKVGEGVWTELTQQRRTIRIYGELRLLDAERLDRDIGQDNRLYPA